MESKANGADANHLYDAKLPATIDTDIGIEEDMNIYIHVDIYVDVDVDRRRRTVNVHTYTYGLRVKPLYLCIVWVNPIDT